MARNTLPRKKRNPSGANRSIMLVFFASWCPHCQKEAPTPREV